MHPFFLTVSKNDNRPVFDCVRMSIHLHTKYHSVPHQLLKQLGAQWKWLVDMWKPNTAYFLSDHHRPRFHSAALLNCKKITAVAMAAPLFVASLWELLLTER